MSAAALAKALAHGAIEFVNTLIGAATHPFQIIQKIRSAYGPLSAREAADVFWSGQSAWNAGVAQQQLAPSQQPPLDDIPINSDLFGANPDGFRVRQSVLGEYRIPGENRSRYVNFNVNSDVPLTAEQLAGIWQQRFDELLYDTAKRIGANTGQGAIVVGIEVQSVQRKF